MHLPGPAPGKADEADKAARDGEGKRAQPVEHELAPLRVADRGLGADHIASRDPPLLLDLEAEEGVLEEQGQIVRILFPADQLEIGGKLGA